MGANNTFNFNSFKIAILVNYSDINEIYSNKEIKKIYPKLKEYINTFGLPRTGDLIFLLEGEECSEIQYINIHIESKLIEINI